MPKVHSHYENLKVARDASPEAIRAAYRVLTRQYHPDRNPGDARAERVMAMINVAYEALSDPARKAEHDLWIQRAEAVSARPSQARPSVRSTAAKRATVTPTPARKPDRGPLVAAHITRYRLAYAVVGSIACALALVVALTMEDPVSGLIRVLATFAAIQFMDTNFTGPRIVGNSVGLHPIWIMIALTMSGAFFGFIGLLLAIPLAVLVKMILTRGIARYKASPMYNA